MEHGPETLSLAQALAILRRRAPLIVVCTLCVAAAALAFSKQQAKEYTATASLAFDTNPLSQQIAGLPVNATANQFVQQASNIQLVGLGDAAAKTAAKVGQGLSAAEVRESIGIAGQGESNVVAVSATTTSPLLAAEIATTYTHQFVEEQQRANEGFFKSALALVKKQLAALPSNQRFGNAAVALQNRAQSLQLLQDLQSDDVYVAQNAPLPTAPSAPQTSKNTVIGGILGLLLGLGLAFVLERFRRDRRILDVHDLEETYDLPLLGAIPESSALARSPEGNGHGPAAIPAAEAEACRLIRGRLRFAAEDREVRTVLVTSANRGDGRTTVSRCLAEAAATAGSRVLLLEADLRNPSLARQLGLDAGPGLLEVLTGGASATDAIQVAPVMDYSPDALGDIRAVDVLTAGTGSAFNPEGLIASREMKALLDHLRSTYDLVVIDTPTLTAASDALPLLPEVDGAIVLGWIGRSRRDSTRQLREILGSAPGRRLGVIANGARSAANGYDTHRGDGASRPRIPLLLGPQDPTRSDRPIPTAES